MCPGYLLGISWNLARLDLYRHPVYTTVYMLLDTRGLYSSLSAIQLFRADFRASPLNYRPSLTFLSNIPLFLQRSSLFVWCLASIGVFLHEIDRQSIRPMSHVRFYRTESRELLRHFSCFRDPPSRTQCSNDCDVATKVCRKL